MKRKIFLRISFLLATALLIVTCTKSDIEKSREAYDATKVVPVVQGITGAANVLQTKVFTYTVSYDRAGSTWAWTGTDCVIQSVSADTKTATVLFSTLPAAGVKAKISVVETTSGGAVSVAKVFEATVAPFCPMAITDFAGTWTAVETGSKPLTTTVTLVKGAGADEIRIKGSAGMPGLMSKVFIDWGEAFQAGIAPAGDVILRVNVDNGVVSIPFTYWGQTLPGPYDYWHFGAGNWSGCGAKPTITLTIKLDYDGAAPGTARYTNTVVLTKI